LEIAWLGHSCFRLKGKETTVITDPCPPGTGYSLSNIQVDIVTLSHSHPGHCYTEAVTTEFKEINAPGEYEINGAFITGIASFHDADQGEERGNNVVYLLEIDGMVLCHLGDLGHLPSSDLMEAIDDTEVLFVPVGGISTINGSIAAEIVRRLSPRIVIPMHYKTPVSVGDLEPIDKFLKDLGSREVISKPKISLNRSSMPANNQVIILDYSN